MRDRAEEVTMREAEIHQQGEAEDGTPTEAFMGIEIWRGIP